MWNFTFVGALWLDVCPDCVRPKTEKKAKFYSRGRAVVVLTCEVSSKNNLSVKILEGCVVLLWELGLSLQTSCFHSHTTEKSENIRQI